MCLQLASSQCVYSISQCVLAQIIQFLQGILNHMASCRSVAMQRTIDQIGLTQTSHYFFVAFDPPAAKKSSRAQWCVSRVLSHVRACVKNTGQWPGTRVTLSETEHARTGA